MTEMPPADDDHAAIVAACEDGVALCTIVAIEGSFSRRAGSQLAVQPDGTTVGSLSDGCLEQQLASDVLGCTAPEVRRYGMGSPLIDFRLPCGGGLDILLDPAPDRDACRKAVAALERRELASVALPEGPLKSRGYMPALRLVAFGEDPELGALMTLAEASGIECVGLPKDSLALGQAPDLAPPDRWTATVLLFHDHEWEAAILRHALSGDSFFIGAQGGEVARGQREARLAELGVPAADIARIRAPVGAIPGSRTPRALALSILGQVVAEYEALHPHA